MNPLFRKRPAAGPVTTAGPLALLCMLALMNPVQGAVLLDDSLEDAQPFTDGSPAGGWVRGSTAAYWEAYAAGGGILNRAAADLGAHMVSLNPTPADAWIYRDTGVAFAPNTTYTVTLHAGSRQNTPYQHGGVIEFGLWSGVPAQPQTQALLSPDRPGAHRVDTSTFPAQTMVKVAAYSFTTGSNVAGMGNLVVFVRNLASANGRSSIDAIRVESDGVLPDRPNILWIVAEDLSPTLGCYGDVNAITPRLDALAAEGIRFNHCWANAPICSVARTTLITGTHATRNGGFSHRSAETLHAPAFMRFYPRLLQEAGYYTSNNSKEDYNVQPPAGREWRKGWNDSSGSAHWRNAPTGMPFFAVFNIDTTHESRIRPVGGTYPVATTHNPATIVLPDCHPDLPSLREAWAKHHDDVTAMDGEAGAILDALAADGLDTNTVVFFYGDHGSCVPGYKRFVGNRGQRTPLIARFPPTYAHLAPPASAAGVGSDELVSFVDFAPTLLSLVGCEIPAWMHGRAFAGVQRQAPPDHLIGYVCRHDTRIADARSVTDGRHVYIRNYHPDTPHGNWSSYTQGVSATTPPFGTLGAGEWLLAWLYGGLSPKTAHFFKNHRAEELYDLANDPDETVNLVGDPGYAPVLATLSSRLDAWQNTHRDGGLMPEGRLYDLVDATGLSAWEVIGNDAYYPYADVLDSARRAIAPAATNLSVLAGRLGHADATVRLWAARGLGYHGREAVRAHQAELLAATSDTNYWVRVGALQALALHADAVTRSNSIHELFGLCNRWGIVTSGVVDRSVEREIHFAGEAISHLPYLASSYRGLTSTMNNETYLTQAYRRQVYYWFYDEFHHPLAEFRALHGLGKWGADDFSNPAGDGIPNVFKYAYNLASVEGDLLVGAQPRHLVPGGDQGLPVLFLNPTNHEPTLQFIRRKSGTDSRLQYAPEQSGDVTAGWSALTSSAGIESINSTWERVTAEVGGEPRSFLRIQVIP